MRIVAGCDGGGTSCVVRMAIVDREGVVRQEQAVDGPANVCSDSEGAFANIANAVHAAREQLELSADLQIDSFVAGLAGAASVNDPASVEAALLRRLGVQRLQMVPDVDLLFAASEARSDAVATVIGTGSIAWYRNEAGSLHRAGGLGPDVGDEGSGYWIGRRGVDAGVCAMPTDDSPNAIAALAGQVFAAAVYDSVAREVCDVAARHIADQLLEAVATSRTSHATPLPWICAGGVALHQPEWLDSIRDKCLQRGLHLARPILIAEPVAGALKLAIALLQT